MMVTQWLLDALNPTGCRAVDRLSGLHPLPGNQKADHVASAVQRFRQCYESLLRLRDMVTTDNVVLERQRAGSLVAGGLPTELAVQLLAVSMHQRHRHFLL